MTDRPKPPTVAERLAFDAATGGSPKRFVDICRMAGREPEQLLNSFDWDPWRWLFNFSPSDLVTDAMRRESFPPELRARLEATRRYVEAPRWRRMFIRR